MELLKQATRYVSVVIPCIFYDNKTHSFGEQIILLSPYNTVPAQLHLLQTVNCKVFLTPNVRPPAVATILATPEHGLRILEIPTVEQLYTARSKSYPYMKTFEEACDEPLVMMHTSGSTGFPKPIVWTHGFCAAYAASLQLDPPPEAESVDQMYMGNRIFVMFPRFHVSLDFQFPRIGRIL